MPIQGCRLETPALFPPEQGGAGASEDEAFSISAVTRGFALSTSRWLRRCRIFCRWMLPHPLPEEMPLIPPNVIFLSSCSLG